MYKIEKQSWGYKLSFAGFISKDEMQAWVQESGVAVKSASGAFGVYVDMRELKPLAPEVQAVMVTGQQYYKQAGMQRSVVVVDSTITAMQFKRLARQSGIYAWERYVSSTEADWETKAMEWLTAGVDPDKAPVA